MYRANRPIEPLCDFFDGQSLETIQQGQLFVFGNSPEMTTPKEDAVDRAVKPSHSFVSGNF